MSALRSLLGGEAEITFATHMPACDVKRALASDTPYRRCRVCYALNRDSVGTASGGDNEAAQVHCIDRQCGGRVAAGSSRPKNSKNASGWRAVACR